MNFLTPIIIFASSFYLAACQNEFVLTATDDENEIETHPTRIFLDSLEQTGYDPQIFPDGVNGPGSHIDVFSTMYLLDIQKVDDFSMDFSAQFYFRQSWNDSRLIVPDFETEISLRDVNKIWTPDLFFTEEKQGRLHKIMGPNMFCRIKGGEVLFSSRLSMTFKCPMDLRRYPHDIQKCIMNIESYGFKREQMNLHWDYRRHDPVTASKELSMFDFALIKLEPTKKESEFTFGNYSVLQVSFVFQRNPGFFVTRLFVPFIIMVFLCGLSFWINVKEKALRLTLLLVILYLMTNIGSEINGYIPPVPYTKASDVWIAFCQSFVFASFLEFILVFLLSQKKRHADVDACKKDPEIASTSEADSKLFSKTNSTITSMGMYVARRLKTGKDTHRLDIICRWIFPALFLIFCVLYALIYCVNY